MCYPHNYSNCISSRLNMSRQFHQGSDLQRFQRHLQEEACRQPAPGDGHVSARGGLGVSCSCLASQGRMATNGNMVAVRFRHRLWLEMMSPSCRWYGHQFICQTMFKKRTWKDYNTPEQHECVVLFNLNYSSHINVGPLHITPQNITDPLLLQRCGCRWL